jgi:hypothetical protein
MAWKTLSFHFRQLYEGGYRYFDKCGEYMVTATSKFNVIPGEIKPTGAKMEIPEMGVHANCDSTALEVSQELATENIDYFTDICSGLSALAVECFEPKSIIKNGFASKSYWPFAELPDLFAATLKFTKGFDKDLAKVVDYVPEHQQLDYMFVSGNRDFHIVLHAVTFERNRMSKRNVAIRSNKIEKDRIDRRNKLADRFGETPPYALVLELDLMENDPPQAGSLKDHFNELYAKTEELRKFFAIK